MYSSKSFSSFNREWLIKVQLLENSLSLHKEKFIFALLLLLIIVSSKK